MFHALKGPGKLIAASLPAFLILAAAACKPATQAHDGNQTAAGGKPSAVDQYLEARRDFAAASQQLSKELRPITDRDALARQLKLPPDRFAVIKTGAQAGPVVVAFDQSQDCDSGGHCICFGEKSCNQMFSGLCRSESTDGSCEGSGDSTACSCEVSPDTPTPTEPG